MKLRELYSQETSINLISTINRKVEDFGARLPGFGIRRLPVGILTVFWLLVWVCIIGFGTSLTVFILDIPLSVIYTPWSALSADVWTAVQTPVGLSTTIALVYGVSMYVKTVYTGGTTQEMPDKSLNAHPLYLSLIIAGIGIYMFFTGITTNGFAITLFGVLVATHYTKKITLHDRATEFTHYDLHHINAIVRSTTIWSTVYWLTSGVSLVALLPLVFNTAYITSFIVRRNYTETLATVYDRDKSGFRNKLRSSPLFYRQIREVLESEGETDGVSDGASMTREDEDSEMNLYENMPQRTTSSPNPTPETATREQKLKGEVETAVDVDPRLVNDLEQKLQEFVDVSEGATESSEVVSDIDPEIVYQADETYFKALHQNLMEIESATEPNTPLSQVTNQTLRISQQILEELDVDEETIQLE